MILFIADSGSTTTDWAIVKDNKILKIKTAGINPIHQDNATICDTIISLQERCKGISPQEIYFYGAGCIDIKANKLLHDIMVQAYPNARIYIASDLLGAARSLCQHNKGIAGILGTGANSCRYDGENIIQNIPPLGYILGDEGSGAALGKAFLRKLLRGELGETLRKDFYTEYETDYQQLIRQIYRMPAANKYLASISPFIARHLYLNDVKEIALDSFSEYFRNHIMQYDYKNEPIHLTGSIAYHYKDVIQEAAQKLGLTVESITAAPIDQLVTYHTQYK